jgi:hypothetical protein
LLNNGNDYIRKRDEETTQMKVEAKEVRAKINKTNDDNLRQQMRHDKLMKVLNHRNGG